MATDTCVFDSSDSVRSAVPLKYAQYVTFQEPLALEEGGSLPVVRVAYETYGTLSPAADNAVLICHALSGDSHVARHDADDTAGWWDLVVGPGKAIDTDRYFVICPNLLGGCRGTTGPNSVNPETGRPYAADFPTHHRPRHGRGPEAAGRAPGHPPAAGRGGRIAGRATGPDLGHAIAGDGGRHRWPWPPRRG